MLLNVVEMLDRPKIGVEKYFYKKVETLSKIQCQAQCIFDEEHPCHFSVLSEISGDCYLGSISTQNSIINTGSLVEQNVTMFLAKGKFFNFFSLEQVIVLWGKGSSAGEIK